MSHVCMRQSHKIIRNLHGWLLAFHFLRAAAIVVLIEDLKWDDEEVESILNQPGERLKVERGE